MGAGPGSEGPSPDPGLGGRAGQRPAPARTRLRGTGFSFPRAQTHEEALQRTARVRSRRPRGPGTPGAQHLPGASPAPPLWGPRHPARRPPSPRSAAVPKSPSFLPRPVSCFEDKLAVSSGAESSLPETPSQP